jgi:hypothetical protein
MPRGNLETACTRRVTAWMLRYNVNGTLERTAGIQLKRTAVISEEGSLCLENEKIARTSEKENHVVDLRNRHQIGH